MSKRTKKTGEGRYRKTLWINDIILDVLDGLFSKSEEGMPGVVWKDAVGSPVNIHTKPISTKEGVLTVEVENPVWRQQLEFLKEELKDKLNKKLPDNRKIKKIKFIGAKVFRSEKEE
ncbi:DUF721 domain-containing protein [candidate division WOR-3 bacterium]|nr:DUF721 domain-containing protein [candidate division WOR-3 bacterium]